MTTVLLAVLLVLVLFAAMAVGQLFGRPPIKGSCGGMSALAAKGECAICGGDSGKCEEATRPAGNVAPGDQTQATVHRVDPGQPR